jgi:glycosyltransferase involved in cell wall biosynthesis
MKIVCIASSQVPSSTANSIQVMKVCQAMAQIGHKVHLLAPGPARSGSSLQPDLADYYGLTESFPIQWLPVSPAWRHYDLAYRAVRLARRMEADAVYTWMLQAAVLALWQGLPAYFEAHIPVTGKVAPLLFRLFMRSRGKKRLLPITYALQRVLEKESKIIFPSNEVVVAPDGVDLERYADLPDPPQARARLGLPEQPTAMYTGHLYPGRGLELLAGLARAHPDIHFLWVGGRPADVDHWRTRLAESGVSNVTLTGFVENSRLALYQAAGDVLLMPYERKVEISGGGNTADICSPMKMFEYMAVGRAILSSDLPVLHEVLDETMAVFCLPNDFTAWSLALASLMADPGRRQALSARARASVVQYSWQNRTRRILDGFFQERMKDEG